MNLYWRLAQLLLKNARQRPARSLFEEAVTHLRVYPNDLDTNFHMNNGRYLTLMDLGRLDYLAQAGLWWPALARRWVAVIGSSQMVHLKELRVFERFELRTKLECWDARWFIITQRFVRGDRVHALGRVRGQVHGPQGLVPPETFLRLHPEGMKSSPKPSEATRLWLESLKAGKDGAKLSADAVHQPQDGPAQ